SHGAVAGTLRAVVAGGGVPAPGTLRADRWIQMAGRGARSDAPVASLGPADGRRRADSQGSHLRTESRWGPHAGVGRSLDRPGAGTGRRHEPSRGGRVVGAAQKLGMPAAGTHRAVGTQGAG